MTVNLMLLDRFQTPTEVLERGAFLVQLDAFPVILDLREHAIRTTSERLLYRPARFSLQQRNEEQTELHIHTQYRAGVDPRFVNEWFVGESGGEKSPIGCRSKAPLGGLWDKSPRHWDILQIILQ